MHLLLLSPMTHPISLVLLPLIIVHAYPPFLPFRGSPFGADPHRGHFLWGCPFEGTGNPRACLSGLPHRIAPEDCPRGACMGLSTSCSLCPMLRCPIDMEQMLIWSKGQGKGQAFAPLDCPSFSPFGATLLEQWLRAHAPQKRACRGYSLSLPRRGSP